MRESGVMTYGPLEYAAWLRRRKSRGSAKDGADPGNQLKIISGPAEPTPISTETDTLCADALEEIARHTSTIADPSD